MLSNIGFTLEKLGQRAEAVNHLKTALVIAREMLGNRHPETMQSWANVVAVLLRLHRKAEALSLVDTDLKKFPGNPTLKRLKNEILGKPPPKKPTPKKR